MTTCNAIRHIFVDPPSPAYYEDRLFDRSNAILNRDETLEPFIRLREVEVARGNTMHTADRLVGQAGFAGQADYYSLGILKNFSELKKRENVRLKAFVIFEPPVVDPRMYRQLPELTHSFDTVYLHNTDGDGYSLKNVQQSKLRKLNWPQPRAGIIEAAWHTEPRSNRIVVINGNHRPQNRCAELYSVRIEAMAALAAIGAVDLHGRGWDKWWSRSSMWMPYWKHRSNLMDIYKGPCESKFDVLSSYRFCLCFENMEMRGYVTEKIFDCFYAGTIPIYLGATNISDLVPNEAYIDCREFGSWQALRDATLALTPERLATIKNAGLNFLQSAAYLKYFNSLIKIFETPSKSTG